MFLGFAGSLCDCGSIQQIPHPFPLSSREPEGEAVSRIHPAVLAASQNVFSKDGFQIKITSRSSVCTLPVPAPVSSLLSSSDLCCDFNFDTICCEVRGVKIDQTHTEGIWQFFLFYHIKVRSCASTPWCIKWTKMGFKTKISNKHLLCLMCQLWSCRWSCVASLSVPSRVWHSEWPKTEQSLRGKSSSSHVGISHLSRDKMNKYQPIV